MKFMHQHLDETYSYEPNDQIDFRMEWLEEAIIIFITKITEKGTYIFDGKVSDINSELLNKFMLEENSIKHYKREKELTYKAIIDNREKMVLNAIEYGNYWNLADKAFSEFESKLDPEVKLLLEVADKDDLWTCQKIF